MISFPWDDAYMSSKIIFIYMHLKLKTHKQNMYKMMTIQPKLQLRPRNITWGRISLANLLYHVVVVSRLHEQEFPLSQHVFLLPKKLFLLAQLCLFCLGHLIFFTSSCNRIPSSSNIPSTLHISSCTVHHFCACIGMTIRDQNWPKIAYC